MGRVRYPDVAKRTADGVMSPVRLVWRRDFWFLLGIAWLAAVTVAALTAGAGALQPAAPRAANVPAAATAAPTKAAPSATPTLPANVSVQPAGERVYSLSGPNPGVMQPAMDAQGNLWFGEMGTNKLARLDSRSGAVTTWMPPDGKYNVMQTVVDGAGTIWFTEQAANYIGRFDPASQQFTTYPLEQPGGHSAAPQALAFDAHGMLWFTEVSAGKIGRLDPGNGQISTWPVPALPGGARPYPFALAIAPDGGIWFGEIGGGAIGRLDPASGQVRLSALADAKAQVFSMAADASGNVWFTELEQGKLGVVDSRSGVVREMTVPASLGNNLGLYAVVAAGNGDVWFACSGSNALVRYVPPSGHFTFYTLAAPTSVPYGLALDGSGRLWFTAAASPQNYVGVMHV